MLTNVDRPLPTEISLPLWNSRVLDLTRVLARATAIRFLGALGADVLRDNAPRALLKLLDRHLDIEFAKHKQLRP